MNQLELYLSEAELHHTIKVLNSLNKSLPGYKKMFNPKQIANGIWTGKVDIDDLQDYAKKWLVVGGKEGQTVTKTITKYKDVSVGATGLQYIAIVTLILIIARITYKRFLSKAARDCRGTSGARKTICMAKYKVKAIDLRIKDLQKGTSTCKYTKSPGKCKLKIQKEIMKLQRKSAKLQRGLQHENQLVESYLEDLQEREGGYAAMANHIEDAMPSYKQMGMNPEGFAKGIYTGKIDMEALNKWIAQAYKWGITHGKRQAKAGKAIIKTVTKEVPREVPTSMHTLGSIAIATLVIMATYHIYKRFMSDAAKACRGLSGESKTICMAKYKLKGYSMRMTNLNKGLINCKTTKNPNKCQSKINSRLRLLKIKSLKLKRKI